LEDYSVRCTNISILCDNTSINLSKNPIQHFRSKDLEIKHHFTIDHVHKNDVKLMFIPTKIQLEDIFTTSVVEDRFFYFLFIMQIPGIR